MAALSTDHQVSTNGLNGGVQVKYEFPNGYGASVVQSQYSYGGDRGLWEIAVLGIDGHLNYDTPITNDVIGYLSEPEVNKVLADIAALEAVA